ncbi:MAG: ABC transporter ATP-binding protein [Myxococcota bacterium]|jgi:ABC-2 type transport system ATP-binding protein|nr:ABC transporter ATP-binding protein [Myxococcota bacterium]
MSVISFSDVRRGFGKTMALSGVSLEIAQGESVGLIGRNGAGKTTLLRMIPALLRPDSGDVRVFGLQPFEQPEEVKRHVGYLAGGDPYPQWLRSADLFALCEELYPSWDKALAAHLSQSFKLDVNAALGTLSTGQQRQAGFLCAVCHRPKLLVLDEPAANLDPAVRREFLEVVLDLVATMNTTLILSSHQFADIERLASRVVILHEGRVLADRPIEDLQERSCQVLVAGADPKTIRALPSCLRVRPREDGVLATFGADAATAHAELSPLLGAGARIADTRTIGLEDLFIDWTSGE